MQQKTISLHVDCCKVKCGINKEVSLQRPEKEFGSGCDMVITDGKYGYVYICEVKRGRITLEDAGRALKQIEYCESKYRQKTYSDFLFTAVVEGLRHWLEDSSIRIESLSRVVSQIFWFMLDPKLFEEMKWLARSPTIFLLHYPMFLVFVLFWTILA